MFTLWNDVIEKSLFILEYKPMKILLLYTHSHILTHNTHVNSVNVFVSSVCFFFRFVFVKFYYVIWRVYYNNEIVIKAVCLKKLNYANYLIICN